MLETLHYISMTMFVRHSIWCFGVSSVGLCRSSQGMHRYFNDIHKYSIVRLQTRHIHQSLLTNRGERAGHSRYLKDPNEVWKYNNWDDAEWDEEQEQAARSKVEENSSDLVLEELREKYEVEADHFWDQFYNQHQNRFFKDRHWLFVQFPELAPKGYNPTVVSARSGSLNSTGIEGASSSGAKQTNDAQPPTNDCQSPANDAQSPGSNIDSKPKEGIHCDQGGVSIVETAANAEKLDSVCQSVQDPIDKESVANVQGQEDNISQSAQSAINEETISRKADGIPQEKSIVEGETANEAFPGEHGKMRVFEVGCGVGNTVFPVLQTNNDPDLFVYCCDLSETAIQIIKTHDEFEPWRCHAFVADATDLTNPLPFPEESLDAVILIFVLSAIHPEKMQATISRLARHLKPGGIMLFRDYGRYDLAQLRFKKGKCLSPNFYVRGDGTRVYFFTQDELRTMFMNAGLTEEVQNYQDRRLQVNRGRQLKMYRVWIQCKYRKPLLTCE